MHSSFKGRGLVFDRKRRCAVFALGVMVAGFGIALSTQSGLGATPISSVPWVLTYITHLSYGTLTLLSNLIFIAGQIVLLRRKYELFQLLQIPATALFGLCIDLGMWATRPFVTTNYVGQLVMLVLGALTLATGIGLQVLSDYLCVPGDALVKTIVRVFHFPISRVKISLDGTLVATACLCSFLCLGHLVGVREGTFMSVFLVGWFLGRVLPPLRIFRKLCYHY